MSTQEGGVFQVELNRAGISWDLDAGTVSFFGIPAATFWLDPSLLHMLRPLVEEMGAPLFRLLVARESSQGTDEDYDAMVTTLGSTFPEGFLAWGRAVASAGWGVFELSLFEPLSGRAAVRVRNPWELRMQARLAESWGCPFLMGKIIGIFSHALATPCWAEEREGTEEGGEPYVEFDIHASDRTIDGELERLRYQRNEDTRLLMERRIQGLFDEQRQQIETIHRQQQALIQLSVPILQVWQGVLALPLVGPVSAQRAADITATLLDAVARAQARFTILDLTGVDVIDTATAEHLTRIVRAIRLLGGECLVCGIQPAVAQAMVSLGAEAGARTFGTMQSALQTAIGGLR